MNTINFLFLNFLISSTYGMSYEDCATRVYVKLFRSVNRLPKEMRNFKKIREMVTVMKEIGWLNAFEVKGVSYCMLTGIQVCDVLSPDSLLHALVSVGVATGSMMITKNLVEDAYVAQEKFLLSQDLDKIKIFKQEMVKNKKLLYAATAMDVGLYIGKKALEGCNIM